MGGNKEEDGARKGGKKGMHPVLQSFWRSEEDALGGGVNSRYRQDFDEINLLGKGGFGSVIKVKNKLDGRLYAVKSIRVGKEKQESEVGDKDGNTLAINERILREVKTLSRLEHEHVVRYYQAWVEGGEQHVESWGAANSQKKKNESRSRKLVNNTTGINKANETASTSCEWQWHCFFKH